ncbi:hypothetical protein WN51_14162 [Melipona quadrifasciata]|uniref:Uncharacterized protein n=1 Tax=Melipona quadrifasciata TaxID=166423 RepID=A0A0N0U525_9HYME|nr:hypothetical protein WN51_14162 [Melipona quadrifasciata]
MEGRPDGPSGERFRRMLISSPVLTEKSLSVRSGRACADERRCGEQDDLESSYQLSEEARDSVGVSVRCGCGSYADRACVTGFAKLQRKVSVLVRGSKEAVSNVVPRMAAIFVVVCLLLLDTRPTFAANNVDDDGVFGERKWKTSGVDDGKQKEKGGGTGLLSFEGCRLGAMDGFPRGEKKSILIGVALWCY